MYQLPAFCRVCLRYDKDLIDLDHIENEPEETLKTKLLQCVSDVDWQKLKPLMCHPCIKRLNTAYNFRKQCTQSTTVLKNYLDMLTQESQKKNTAPTIAVPNAAGGYMLLQNQNFVKIVVGNATSGGNAMFQNVMLIPTAPIGASGILQPVNADGLVNLAKTPDGNQNVGVNALPKLLPGLQPLAEKVEDKKTVNDFLNEKSEEVSVELDPTYFTSMEDDDEQGNDEENGSANEEDDHQNESNELESDQSDNMDKTNSGNRYVPILPKPDLFFNSGQHFLSLNVSLEHPCEACEKNFSTIKLLLKHLTEVHDGELPFKCDICQRKYPLRTSYEHCLNKHLRKDTVPDTDTSLTLKDFCTDADLLPKEPRQKKEKKKYFIKGSKSAKCDICNRDFSTYSYLQLHKKLHLREDFTGYKRHKVPTVSSFQNKPEDKVKENAKPKIKAKSKLNGHKDEAEIKEEPKLNGHQDDEAEVKEEPKLNGHNDDEAEVKEEPKLNGHKDDEAEVKDELNLNGHQEETVSESQQISKKLKLDQKAFDDKEKVKTPDIVKTPEKLKTPEKVKTPQKVKRSARKPKPKKGWFLD